MNQLSHKVQDEDITKRYGYPWYPRHVKDSEGRVIEAKDHIQHGRIIGKKVREDATIVEPPTLETVMAAGYPGHVAEKIVAQEQEKAAKGYKPYGDIEPPVSVQDVAPQQDPPKRYPVVDSDGKSLGMGGFINTEEDVVPAIEPGKSTVDDSEELETVPPTPKSKKKTAPQPENWE